MRINRESFPESLTESPWFAPLIMSLGVLIFFGVIIGLVFWIKPPLQDIHRHQKPLYTFSPNPVSLNIGSLKLQLPQNYIRKIKKLHEKKNQEIILHMLLPDMQPYQENNWWLFENKTPKSKMLLLRLTQMDNILSEQIRFQHLYDKQLERNVRNERFYGLTHYFYKDPAKHPYRDIFTGYDHNERRLIYFCFRPGSISLAPHCLRRFAIAPDTRLTYRFKRAHLKDWKTIDRHIQDFITKIRQVSSLDQPVNPVSVNQ